MFPLPSEGLNKTKNSNLNSYATWSKGHIYYILDSQKLKTVYFSEQDDKENSGDQEIEHSFPWGKVGRSLWVYFRLFIYEVFLLYSLILKAHYLPYVLRHYEESRQIKFSNQYDQQIVADQFYFLLYGRLNNSL